MLIDRSDAPVLTELGYQVLRLSATGMMTDEVAAHLRIGADEVRRHLIVAMAALGARSKLEAVVLAVGLGLVTLPGAGARPRPG